ncbi:MAG: hypothetical protein AABX84_01020 [Nanoarchaeota archaeon]
MDDHFEVLYKETYEGEMEVKKEYFVRDNFNHDWRQTSKSIKGIAKILRKEVDDRGSLGHFFTLATSPSSCKVSAKGCEVRAISHENSSETIFIRQLKEEEMRELAIEFSIR